MSVLNQSGEEQVECPLCMEPLEVDDLHFYPCTCGYQICRFCWNRIREGENGLCPACRKAYPENPADFTPLSQEQVAAIKTEKKAREQKRRNKTLESRRALANVRVVQKNLVFVVGLPVRLADPEILKRQEYFGKYGKIHKVVINQSTTYAGSQGPSASAYVTYVSCADALRAIQGVNNVALDGRVLKGSLGTTKYCANFMKNMPCPKTDCMYLHELGDSKASFTKEEMHAGLHQVYERKLHNQLLQSQRDKPDERQPGSGNSSTNAEKGSSKEGSQSNFIPTTVVTSSHINVVNSSKSKKDPATVSSGSSSSSNGGSGASSSASSGKDAWPSLSCSPPSDCPPSPQPTLSTAKSQENGISEFSNSSTHAQQPPAKRKEQHTGTKPSRSKENATNGHTKKSKSDKKKASNNSINNVNVNSDSAEDSKQYNNSTQPPSQSVFESESQSFLTNELDELESDRHSLLENHDLLDNSDHSLLEDDNTHNLLNDANNEIMMMQRHREMLAGLVDNSHVLPQMKNSLVNGYGLLDRDMSYIGNDNRPLSQINQGLLEQKESLLRERTRSELLMRQNELLARQHNIVEPKHFMPISNVGLESNSELLGANYHPNHNMLPPFGMRVEGGVGSMGSGLAPAPGLAAGLQASFLMQHQMMQHQQAHSQLQQQLHQPMVNGFDTSQATHEGRYQAENMDKFFTDFHKAQQMRQMARGADDARYEAPRPRVMLSAASLEMEHKHRMNNMRSGEGQARASGDGDDDLDFDPFKETQKALAEMMETEMKQNTVPSGDSMDRVRARLAPPGFGPQPAYAPPRHHTQGYNTSGSTVFSDWTQMDPAIMSTSASAGAGQPQSQAQAQAIQQQQLQQQQELWARFSQLGVGMGAQVGMGVNVGVAKAPASWPQQKLWGSFGVPLPPGFAPPKPGQHPAECIDAK